MNAMEALQEAERRIVAMVDHRYYGGSQEIGGRDALRHVRDVLAEVAASDPSTPPGQASSS